MIGYVKLHFNEMRRKAVDWIALNHDKFKWQAVVNTVTTECFPLNAGNLLIR
jgi:hypothetical protein